MGIRFASLGSGSKGNGTLLESASTSVLVDCGFSVRETEKRLARLDRHAQDLSAILVTHEHGDHIRGVMPLARKYSIPVYMTFGTAQALAERELVRGLNLFHAYENIVLGDINVTPVTVPHDAREPVQYIFDAASIRVGILTDLGSITSHVVSHYRDCDGLLLEANHDVKMLAEGVYPPRLKRRVGGDWGHLNNGQVSELLGQVTRSKLQTLVLGHISQQNNQVALVADAISHFKPELAYVVYACQDQGVDWQLVD